MTDRFQSFGGVAKGLARNPLGIIALFIVLVYGFASLVTAFSGSLTAAERLPLIYFLVIFPVLVLAVFAWLVSGHSGKLFAPSDFKNEDNYVKMQMTAVASLGAASAKTQTPGSEAAMDSLVEAVLSAIPAGSKFASGWKKHILWVDDRPDNNIHERLAFEAIGLRFSLVLSTDEAFEKLAKNQYAAIISDMGRREGPREGYVLLDRLREEGDRTPLFFYSSSNAREHKLETRERRGQGCTNNAQELFGMIIKAVIKR